MVVKKVCTVLLVDVGPSMHKHLGSVGDNLSRIVQNKMMYSKIDEFALVLCGADETNNDVHTEGVENAAAAGEEDYDEEYLNIAVKVPMECSTLASADCVAALGSMGGGHAADYLDALTVASDILVRHERGGAFARRVIFVTDLRTPCDLDEDFIQGIAAGMRGASVQLTVAVVGGAGDDDDGDDESSIRETVRANRDMLSRLCASLNAPGLGGAVVAASLRSKVEDASEVLPMAQVKQPRPTTTFRGDLELTPWVSLKVFVYKKISEQKPPPMKKCNEEGADEVDEVKGESERSFMSFANPDEPVEVPPEMMISAWPYGPANIPVQEDVRKLMASKNDKGMKIFGFTSLDTVPQWYGMEEARVLVPHPTKDISAAAGLAATAGCSRRPYGEEREAGKAVAAMSALARAMERKGVAALTRAVWTQNSDKVSFGALTPHIVPEGDFLLFVPMPYSEDMYSSEFKPLPVTGSAAAAQLPAAAAAKLVPTQEQRAAAAALVDALDGAGPTPWKHLNPALSRTHALLHARAVDELALPLAPPAGGGPEAAAALTAPPLKRFAQHALPCAGGGGGVGTSGGGGGGGSSGGGGGGGGSSGGGGDGGAMVRGGVPEGASAAAEGFLRACGGLPLAEAKGAWRKRRLEEAAAAEASAPPGEGEERGAEGEPAEREPVTEPDVHRRRREDGGAGAGAGGVGSGGPGESTGVAAGGAVVAAGGGEGGGGGGTGGAIDGDVGNDGWAPVVKDEPGDDDDVEDPNLAETQALHEFEVESPPPPAEDDEFFDDMD